MSTARPAVGDLFNPGAQSLTGTFDPVYVAREAVVRELERHASAVGRRRVDAALRCAASSSGCWVATSRCCAAATPSGGSPCRSSSCGTLAPRLPTAFYQNFSASPGLSAAPGRFIPGSIALGQAGWLPQSCARPHPLRRVSSTAPAQYAEVVHMKESTFLGGTVAGMQDDIRQPYASSWTVGIQRDLGGQRALEVRYNGNRTRNQWLAHNINEVNIFENGFLDEFKNAQRNLSHQPGGRRDVLRQPRPAGADGPPHHDRDGHRVQQHERRQPTC